MIESPAPRRAARARDDVRILGDAEGGRGLVLRQRRAQNVPQLARAEVCRQGRNSCMPIRN